jgi:hypothetical protein
MSARATLITMEIAVLLIGRCRGLQMQTVQMVDDSLHLGGIILMSLGGHGLSSIWRSPQKKKKKNGVG